MRDYLSHKQRLAFFVLLLGMPVNVVKRMCALLTGTLQQDVQEQSGVRLQGDRELLTTQILIRGFEGNAKDGVYADTRDLIDRELILADFTPIKDSKIGELACNFDIILGRTPDERANESPRR